MTHPNFIRSSQKKEILAELEENYGIEKLNYLLIEAGKKKIRGFSGSLTKEEIALLTTLTKIEVIGIYLASKKDEVIRLNFDVAALFQNQITKNIIQINKNRLDLWLRGYDLDFPFEEKNEKEKLSKIEKNNSEIKSKTDNRLVSEANLNKQDARTRPISLLGGWEGQQQIPTGTVTLKYGEDIVGFGKSNGQKVYNYVPKERKLKIPMPKITQD